jgi:hypothetical protein
MKRKVGPPVSCQEEDIDLDEVIYRGEIAVGEQPPAKIKKTEKKKGDGYPRTTSKLHYFSQHIYSYEFLTQAFFRDNFEIMSTTAKFSKQL